MHELSIAENIIEIVKENLQDNSAKVRSVRVRIGELSGVIPESLEFCFAAATAGSILEGAKLVLERTELTGRCSSCGAESKIVDMQFDCRECGGNDLKIITGNELQVVDLELDDDPGENL